MKNSRQNTAAQILDSLTNDIIQGEYSPRQKLHIKTLKERYNVGTSPLREALSQLIAKDLVISKNQRGFYVSDISIDDLTDIYQARAKIESLCIEMAIEKGDDFWEANLIAASHRLNKYSKSDKIDMGEWQSPHAAFHEALVVGCMSDCTVACLIATINPVYGCLSSVCLTPRRTLPKVGGVRHILINI